MAERIAVYDWSRTRLGARDGWPLELRTVVDLMLAARQPMFLAWGPDVTWLYNDAFAPLLGAKHPAALGRGALTEVWSEARDILAPLFATVFAGDSVQMDDLALVLDRHGAPEEAHFSFSYTPVRAADGEVLGLFGVCTETSAFVQAERARVSAELALSKAAAEGRAAAERVDLALRAGAIVGTWVWDIPQDRLVADEQFARSFGLDAELCQAGLPLDQVMASIHPDDRERVAEAIAEVLARGGAYRCEYRVLRADGAGYRWTEASGQVEMDAAGAPLRFPGVLVDTEDRRRTEEALMRSNALLTTFMEAVPGVVYAKDLEGRILVGNRGTAQLLGRPYADFVGRTDLELLEDKSEAEAIMANDRRIMTSGVTEQVEESVAFPDGSRAWWHSTKAPLRDERGEVIGLIGSSVDITERKRAEEHRQLLLNELNHRVKNTLAVVQGLARQSLRGGAETAQAAASFENRLAALSRAHNLLTDETWRSADLRDTVLDQVSADEIGRRIIVEGPKLALSPAVTVNLALALHELCTNATKYGALSSAEGQVRIAWSVEDDGRSMRLTWTERGGPPVSPPQRVGFGSRLIERAMAAEVGGRVLVRYAPEGLECEIRAPVSDG